MAVPATAATESRPPKPVSGSAVFGVADAFEALVFGVANCDPFAAAELDDDDDDVDSEGKSPPPPCDVSSACFQSKPWFCMSDTICSTIDLRCSLIASLLPMTVTS